MPLPPTGHHGLAIKKLLAKGRHDEFHFKKILKKICFDKEGNSLATKCWHNPGRAGMVTGAASQIWAVLA